MPKVNQEKASDATINPPHPGDPTSDVTRDGGEPLHKPPMEGYNPQTGRVERDEDGNVISGRGDESEDGDVGTREHVKHAAVPSSTGRDLRADGMGGPAESPYGTGREGDSEQAQAWRDDPMPEGAQERLDWVQRGTDTDARLNAALHAEQARGSRKRSSVINGLESLRAEHRRNESENS